jgi:DNA modification methylase
MPSAATKRSPTRGDALRVELVDLARLKRWPRNPKDHDLPALRASLSRFGFVAPILVDEGTKRIVAGHGRLDALLEDQAAGAPPPARIEVRDGRWFVPVVRGLRFRDPREAEAYLIADNQTVILGGFDEARLAEALKDLGSFGALDGTGFSTKDLDDMFKRLEAQGRETTTADPGPQTERAALWQEKWGVVLGQVWTAGGQRIYCGDATDPAAYPRVLRGRLAALVFTDPPYGVSYEARSGRHAPMIGDELRGDALADLIARVLRQAAAFAQESAAFYVWHATASEEDYSRALTAAGLEKRQTLIWAKPSIVLGWGDYRWAHEPCFYACKAGQSPAFYGGRDEGTVWRAAATMGDQLAVLVGPGGVLTDGEGGTLYLTERPPKGRRIRRVHVAKGQSAVLLLGTGGEPPGTLWEVSRDSQPDHPTQKPAELARRAIRNSSQPGEVILDPFAGSGATLVAAEQTSRAGCAIDIEPKYVAATLERLAQMGLEPKVEG